MAAKAKAVDWEAVELHYRAGVRSLKSIGDEFSVSDAGIIKRAKQLGWERDLSERIRLKTAAKVSAAMVSGKVSASRKLTEQQRVEVDSNAQTNIILSHREDIRALKQTVVVMAGELSALAHGALQEALELVLDEKTDKASQTYKTALTKAFNAALALGGRSNAARNLVASLATLIDKERQAFGIDKDSSDRKSLGEFLDAIA